VTVCVRGCLYVHLSLCDDKYSDGLVGYVQYTIRFVGDDKDNTHPYKDGKADGEL